MSTSRLPTASSFPAASAAVPPPHSRTARGSLLHARLRPGPHLVLCLLLLALPIAIAASPKLQANKQFLYERVLTRNGAELAVDPGGTNSRPLNAFSQLYVFDRVERGGETWLQVGAGTDQADGWVRAEQSVTWPQQLAVVFAERGQRERVLVFDERVTLTSLLGRPRPFEDVRDLHDDPAQRRRSREVIAIEPETLPSFSDRFYLLPILEHHKARGPNFDPVKLLRIMAVTEAPPTPTAKVTLRNFRAAVVFVLDSTISMREYIGATNRALTEVSERIDASNRQAVSFGLVSFRGDSRRIHGLGFDAAYLVKPGETDNQPALAQALKRLGEASVSTGEHFTEDALNGIQKALEGTDWSQFDARHLVLVTDAATFERGNSMTKQDIAYFARVAKEKGVAMYALHLRSPEGGGENHRLAREQYRALTANADAGDSLYFPLDVPGTPAFQRTLDELAKSLITYVGAAARGQTTVGLAPPSPTPVALSGQVQSPLERQLERIRNLTSRVVHAQALRWEGRRNPGGLPPLDFSGWIADKSLKDQTIPSVEVRVLLTRNQLDDIAAITKDLVESAEQRLRPSRDFFRNLQELAAQFSNDPKRLAWDGISVIGDHRVLKEYLGNLPYESDVLAIGEDIWLNWERARQQAFITDLRGKLRRFRYIQADYDRWEALAEDAPASEHVYPVRLEELP